MERDSLEGSAIAPHQETGDPKDYTIKVKALVARGWLERDDHAQLAVSTGPLADFSDFNFDRLRDILRTAERIQGVLGARGPSRKPAPGGTARKPGKRLA